MKVQELFPIGSVVKLRNGIRPLMIFGIYLIMKILRK